MSPLKMIVPGVLLLLLAAAGFIYALTRQKPSLESLEPVELELASATPAPTVEVEAPTPAKSSVIEVITQEPPPIKTFAVRILSPAMAETFTAPANVILKASANRQSELKSIEFFNSPGETVCQSLTTSEPFAAELKIGETNTAPYEITWNIPDAGTRTIVAVATYEGGEKQISPPVVIVVNPAEPYDGPEWKGWRPPYPTDQLLDQDFSVMPEPTPTTTRDSCPAIVVKSLPVSRDSNRMNFHASVSGMEVPPDLTFNWMVSAGEIVSGQGTATISVVLDRILDPRVVAAVEVGHLPGICPSFGSMTVAFEQPRWITKEFRSLLNLLRGRITAKQPATTQRYIEIIGERNDCVDEEPLQEAILLRRYLIEYRGEKSENVIIVNGGSGGWGWGPFDLRSVRSDRTLPKDLVEKLRNPLTPCRGPLSASANTYGPPINRTCPDVDEAIKYETTLALRNHDDRASHAIVRKENRIISYYSPSEYQVNICPYNPRDPINTETQLKLDSVLRGGTYSNFPSFQYWANAGRILSKDSVGIWDLSEVKLQPGLYTVIAMANDGCDCTNTDTARARVTNFCSSCLTMGRTCPMAKKAPGRQYFSAQIGSFAVAEKTTFQWTTTKGTIISGQGTADIVIDTQGMQNGEKFVVTVTAGGLLPYCVNKVSQPAVVEEFECIQIPISSLAPEWYDATNRARRRPKPEGTTRISKEEETGNPGNGTVVVGPPRAKDKEWMKISWTPRVKTDESVTVKVVYNRTTESLQVSSAAGDISEEVKLKRRLTEWFGEDYETFGDVRLRTAGLRCDSCDQEQYQSFDNELLEWSWPLKPEGAGTHSFNVDLWLKGEPRNKNAGHSSKPAVKVWTKTENRVAVTEPILTRQTVYAGGGLCAVLGLGLCLRGLKIYRVGDTYNVGQAVAVGHNVSVNNAVVNQHAANSNASNEEKRDA